MVMYIASVCALFCCFAKSVPMNYILLFVFTMCVSWMVGVICALENPTVVAEAASLTAGLTIAISIYAVNTKTDFTDSFFSFAIVVILLSAMCLCIPLYFIFPGPLMHTVYSMIGVALFGFYILYDTKMIMGGAHTSHKFEYDEYILAACMLYLDII